MAAFLARFPPEIQAIGQALCTRVQAGMPAARAELRASENHIAFNAGPSPSDRIVYVCVLPTYVRLSLDYGALLPDPVHILKAPANGCGM